MLITIPGVLSPEQVRHCRAMLDDSEWVDGRVTAGYQGARVKENEQVPESSPVARELGDIVLAALERNAMFISAALPSVVYPPMFNRYTGGGHFGAHVDNAIRLIPGTGRKLRTDVSSTLFLAHPEEYDGGELQIEDTYGTQSVKLAAGDMVVYPSTSLHRVTPVTRGARIACFLWTQSMIRDDAKRALLFDMDGAIQRLHHTNADEPARTTLVGCYHNLLRQWSEV